MNEVETDSIQVTIDCPATIVGPGEPVTDCTETGTFEVSGEFAPDDASIVLFVEDPTNSNNPVEVGTATADENGEWTIQVNIQDILALGAGDGTFTLFATVNEVETDSIQVTIDCPATIVGPGEPVTDCTETGTFEVSGEFAPDDASIVLFVEDPTNSNNPVEVGTATADENGEWTIQVNTQDILALGAGDGTFTLFATVNEVETDSIQVTIDCPATIVGPGEPVTDCTETGTFEVSGEFAPDDASIVLFVEDPTNSNNPVEVGTATADENGEWTIQVNTQDILALGAGDGTFTLFATVNEVETDSIQVTIDCPATIVGPGEPVTDCTETGTFEVSGEFAPDDASIVLFVEDPTNSNNPVEVGTATADENGEWTIQVNTQDILSSRCG